MLRRAILAALAAFCTGVGSGLVGSVWVDVKSGWTRLFGEEWYAFIVEPKDDVCDSRAMPDQGVFGPIDTSVYLWKWRVSRIDHEWHGQASKFQSDTKYDLSGHDLGDKMSITGISSVRNQGIGAYLLTSVNINHPDRYVGYAGFKDCGVKGRPFVLCPMVLRKADGDTSIPETLKDQTCRIIDPSISPPN